MAVNTSAADTTIDSLRGIVNFANIATAAHQDGDALTVEHSMRQLLELAFRVLEAHHIDTTVVRPTDVPAPERTSVDNVPPLTFQEPVDRYTILTRAGQALESRNSAHGPLEPCFRRTAQLWSTLLSTDVYPEQVAACMIAFKLSRLCFSPDHVDSWVDVAGYGAIGAELGTRPIPTEAA
jgi:hypothetical protein